MAHRFYNNSGDRTAWPRATKHLPVGATSAVEDLDLGTCPRGRCEFFEDFTGPRQTFFVRIPLFDNVAEANEFVVTDTTTARGSVMIPRAGILTSVQLTAEDALATHADNHITFTLVNNGNSGAGTTEMLSQTTGAHTTDSDNASAVAISAEIGRPFTVSGTAASLRVAAGDLLTFTGTVAGTLANEVQNIAVQLTFATLPYTVTPRTTKTVGLLSAAPVAGTAHGEATFVLGSTSEANVTGFDWGDQVGIPANARPIYQCRLKISGVAADTRAVWGLADAYAATLDDIVNNAWFRWEGNSLNLLAEVDDSTTDDDDNDTLFDLVASTYYLFTIDCTDKGAIRFSVNDTPYLTLAGAAFAAADVLQPVLYLQKDTGVGTQSITVDYVRCSWDRSV